MPWSARRRASGFNMPVLRSLNRHPAGQPASRAPAKPGSGQRGSAAPALRTIGGLRSDFHPALFDKDRVPRNTNAYTYFCCSFSWARGANLRMSRRIDRAARIAARSSLLRMSFLLREFPSSKQGLSSVLRIGRGTQIFLGDMARYVCAGEERASRLGSRPPNLVDSKPLLD